MSRKRTRVVEIEGLGEAQRAFAVHGWWRQWQSAHVKPSLLRGIKIYLMEIHNLSICSICASASSFSSFSARLCVCSVFIIISSKLILLQTSFRRRIISPRFFSGTYALCVRVCECCRVNFSSNLAGSYKIYRCVSLLSSPSLMPWILDFMLFSVPIAQATNKIIRLFYFGNLFMVPSASSIWQRRFHRNNFASSI